MYGIGLPGKAAAFHTHPMGSRVGITRFSDADKKWADHHKIPVYVHGPNGELRKYDPATGEDINKCEWTEGFVVDIEIG